ncbi:hypothetical protein NKJ88_10620 [Mesorhizobium sp. M0016]|uniref:hypothetical protein n=1 Tax=Mesorhizobium sp. M0016 TaxID=2956843 RepID=UPI00333B428A
MRILLACNECSHIRPVATWEDTSLPSLGLKERKETSSVIQIFRRFGSNPSNTGPRVDHVGVTAMNSTDRCAIFEGENDDSQMSAARPCPEVFNRGRIDPIDEILDSFELRERRKSSKAMKVVPLSEMGHSW